MKNHLMLKDMTRIALFTALLVVCSWITVPAAIPFTLQTLAVFLAAGLLGSARGCLAVLIYLLLGAAGLPVFSGMKGGLSALLGPTGGFLLGFLPAAALVGLGRGKSVPLKILWMSLGLAVCYFVGTVWYGLLYMPEGMGWIRICQSCVFPFLLPDMAKAVLAAYLAQRLQNRVQGAF